MTQPAVNVDQWTDILAKSSHQQRQRQQQHQQQQQQQQPDTGDRIEQALEAGNQPDDDVIHGGEGVLGDEEKEMLDPSMGQEAMERSVTTAEEAQTETEQMTKEVGIQELILKKPALVFFFWFPRNLSNHMDRQAPHPR